MAYCGIDEERFCKGRSFESMLIQSFDGKAEKTSQTLVLQKNQ